MADQIRVALIDDERAVLDALQQYLARQGVSASCFHAAKEFLAALDRREPECIVSDIRMPGMSGLDLLHRLKARRVAAPLILITAVGTSKWRSPPSRTARLTSSRSRSTRAGSHQRPDRRGAAAAARHAAEIEKLRSRFNALSARQRQVMELAVTGIQQGNRRPPRYQPQDGREPPCVGHGAHGRENSPNSCALP